MTVVQIDKNAIRAQAQSKFASSPNTKAAFGDVLYGISAMGPATAELTGQWTGQNQWAGTILSAALSGTELSKSYVPSSWGGPGGYGAYASSPGYMGAPRYAMPGDYGYNSTISPTSGLDAKAADDPAGIGMSTTELMQTMNANNLKMLELQAVIQTQMQKATMLSNLNTAAHKAAMTMIEKLTGRA